jgi:hypothetical protein
VVDETRRHRADDSPFEVVIGGHTPGRSADEDAAIVAPYRAAGATWWTEDISPWPFGWNWQGPWPFAAMEERIRRGPPRG